MGTLEIVKSESMEREEDREENPTPITEALEKFRDSLDTAFRLRRLRDFYDEESIKTIAAMERGEALNNFVSTVAKSVEGEQVCRMFAELENGIQRTTEDFIKSNWHFRTEAELFLKEIVCGEFEKSVGLQLYREPLMEPEKFVEVLNVEKKSAIDCFKDVWSCEAVKPEQISSLTEKLTLIQNELLGKHNNLMESQGSLALTLTNVEQSQSEAKESDGDEGEIENETATSTPTRTQKSPSRSSRPSTESTEKDSNFKKLEQQILEVLKEVQGFIVPTLHFLTTSTECVQTKEKWFALNILKEIRAHLDTHMNSSFTSEECRRAHKNLLKVVQAADDILKLTFPQHKDIPDEDFNAWMQAFKIDVEECLPSQQEFKNTRRAKRIIWITNLICGKMRKYENSHGGWIVEGRDQIRHLLMEEMKGIEKEAEKKKLRAGSKRKFNDCNVKGDGYPEPELLLERLGRIWNTKRETSKTDSSKNKKACKR